MSACGSSGGVGGLVTLKPEVTNKFLRLSELGDDLEVLEVKTSYPIGAQPQIVLSDRFIYLMDASVSMILYQLDHRGQVLRQYELGFDDDLNIRGINHLLVKGDSLGIVSMSDRITWFNDLLQPIGKESLAVKSMYHYPYGEGYLSMITLPDDTLSYDFVAAHSSGIYHQGMPLDLEAYRFIYEARAPITAWQDQVLVSKMFDDTLYRFNKTEGLKQMALVDFGSRAIPQEEFRQIEDAFGMRRILSEPDYAYLQGEIHAIRPTQVLLSMRIAGQRDWGLWNPIENRLVTYRSLKDDFKTGIDLHEISSSKDGQLVFGMDGETFASKASSAYTRQLEKGFEENFFILWLK